MQIVNHSRAVSGLVERRARVYTFDPVMHCIVEQDCDIARRDGHCFGLADARRQPPVEGVQAAPRPGYPNGVCAMREAPEILLLCARQSQEVKCFALAKRKDRRRTRR
jgi:hypothetical protein